MGCIDRSIGPLSSHPHPSSLKEKPKIFPQVSGVPVHLPTFPTDHRLVRSQSWHEPFVNTQAVVDLTQSLGWIINQENSKLNPTRVFSFVGYEYHLDSALVKPTQERWLKLSGFYPTPQVKTCSDYKMFDVSNWVASFNGENGPGGTTSHEALSVSLQGALEIFLNHWTASFLGQKPSLHT